MLRLDFINVGYGDAILIQELQDGSPGFSMLIDCGDLSVGRSYPGSRRISAAEFLQHQQIVHLDVLVLTHLHLDHTGGLLQLLEHTQVDELWTNYLPDQALWKNPPAPNSDFSDGANCLLTSLAVYTRALCVLKERRIRLRLMTQQAAFSFPGGGKLLVLPGLEKLLDRQQVILDRTLSGAPDGKMLEELDRFINTTSIRIRISYCGQVIELPGDAVGCSWAEETVGPCDWLKLPHHGHEDSVSAALLKQLSPRYAIISVSNDRTDNCPNTQILSLLEKIGCKVLFTDAVRLLHREPVFQESAALIIDETGTAFLPAENFCSGVRS